MILSVYMFVGAFSRGTMSLYNVSWERCCCKSILDLRWVQISSLISLWFKSSWSRHHTSVESRWYHSNTPSSHKSQSFRILIPLLPMLFFSWVFTFEITLHTRSMSLMFSWTSHGFPVPLKDCEGLRPMICLFSTCKSYEVIVRCRLRAV